MSDILLYIEHTEYDTSIGIFNNHPSFSNLERDHAKRN